jgi:hypothetical protein
MFDLTIPRVCNAPEFFPLVVIRLPQLIQSPFLPPLGPWRSEPQVNREAEIGQRPLRAAPIVPDRAALCAIPFSLPDLALPDPSEFPGSTQSRHLADAGGRSESSRHPVFLLGSFDAPGWDCGAEGPTGEPIVPLVPPVTGLRTVDFPRPARKKILNDQWFIDQRTRFSLLQPCVPPLL